MRFTSLHRSVPLALAVVLLPVSAAVPAQAASSSQFDAPLLGTTATAQAARFPSSVDLACSDAACTTGVLRNPVGGEVEYSTSTIVRDPGYTAVPEFERGLMTVWSDRGVRSGDVDSVSFAIGQYAAGSDLVAVSKAIAAKVDMALSPVQVDGLEVWAGEIVNDTDSANVYNGSAFKIASVISGDSIIRGTCSSGGTRTQTSDCTLPKLEHLVTALAQRQPGLSAGDRATINRLVPSTVARGITPLVAITGQSPALWGADISNPNLLTVMSRSKSVFAQYTMDGAPHVRLRALYAAVTSTKTALGYVNRPCTTVAQRDCRVTRLVGGVGVQRLYSDTGTTLGRATMVFTGAGNGRLVRIECNQRHQLYGEFTAAQRAQCTKAATRLLAAAVG